MARPRLLRASLVKAAGVTAVPLAPRITSLSCSNPAAGDPASIWVTLIWRLWVVRVSGVNIHSLPVL